MPDSILACQGLCKHFMLGKERVRVFDQLALSVSPGEQVAIIGRSGSGKTTLLSLLAGLDAPDAGSVAYDGRDIYALSAKERQRMRNKHIGLVFQFHYLLPDFTALENVAMPLCIAGQRRTDAMKQASKILEQVGLSHRLNHQPSALSGGERQRVAIARAMVTEPSVLLADEPTGNLDRTTAQSVYDAMLELSKHAKTSFIIVTHDTELAQRMDTIYELSDGTLTRESSCQSKLSKTSSS